MTTQSQPSEERKLLVAETQHAADLVEQMISMPPWKDKVWVRLALSVAARAIRRGRHLRFEEQLENLASSFEEGPFENEEERTECIAWARFLRSRIRK